MVKPQFDNLTCGTDTNDARPWEEEKLQTRDKQDAQHEWDETDKQSNGLGTHLLNGSKKTG
jgi:hypothetical protein